MRDIKAVLAEKELEYRRVWSEVTALRYAAKVCMEPGDASPIEPKPIEPKLDTAESVIDAWPGIAAVEGKTS